MSSGVAEVAAWLGILVGGLTAASAFRALVRYDGMRSQFEAFDRQIEVVQRLHQACEHSWADRRLVVARRGLARDLASRDVFESRRWWWRKTVVSGTIALPIGWLGFGLLAARTTEPIPALIGSVLALGCFGAWLLLLTVGLLTERGFRRDVTAGMEERLECWRVAAAASSGRAQPGKVLAFAGGLVARLGTLSRRPDSGACEAVEAAGQARGRCDRCGVHVREHIPGEVVELRA